MKTKRKLTRLEFNSRTRWRVMLITSVVMAVVLVTASIEYNMSLTGNILLFCTVNGIVQMFTQAGLEISYDTYKKHWEERNRDETN